MSFFGIKRAKSSYKKSRVGFSKLPKKVQRYELRNVGKIHKALHRKK